MNRDEQIVLITLIIAITVVLSIWILKPNDFEACLKMAKQNGGECSYQ